MYQGSYYKLAFYKEINRDCTCACHAAAPPRSVQACASLWKSPLQGLLLSQRHCQVQSLMSLLVENEEATKGKQLSLLWLIIRA